MKKRLFSFLLAFALLVTSLSTTGTSIAFAASTENSSEETKLQDESTINEKEETEQDLNKNLDQEKVEEISEENDDEEGINENISREIAIRQAQPTTQSTPSTSIDITEVTQNSTGEIRLADPNEDTFFGGESISL